MKKGFLVLFVLLLPFFWQQSYAEKFNLNQYLNATAEHPLDVSSWLQNASCQDNYGWSRNSQDAAAGYNKHNTEFDSDAYKGIGIESWYWTPVTNADLIWQEITNLLPGTYVVTAYAVGQVYNDAANKGKCQPGLYLMANGNRTPVTSNKWEKLSVTCTVKSGESLKIGIAADEDNLNDWTSISQVTLECIAPGKAEDIALSEDYDVTCVRGTSFANVMLKCNIPDDQLSTLCLPFDVDSTLTDKCFSEVWAVSEATPHGNEVILITSACDSIEAGQVYLVKAKDGSKSCYEFGNVLVDMTTVGTRSLADGNNLRGTYRQVLTTHPVWVLQEDGKTCHRVDAPTDLKAFGGCIEKE